MKQRLLSLLAAAGLVAGMTVMVPAATVLAASDPGCTALGGVDGAGTCNVSVSSAPAAAVTVLENLHLLNGAHVNLATAGSLTVGNAANPASLEMDKGSSIDGNGAAITVNVPFGNMVMHGTAGADKCYTNGPPPNALPSNALGAQITSTPVTKGTTRITINVGDINALPVPTGSFIMERCSVVATNDSNSSAGTIVINAGHDVDVDGLVLSESGLTGTGANQAPGGGPISIRTSCELKVSSTGVVSSKGRDPGADLVHLQGCDVIIDGLVQSTGSGHAIPNNPANHCAVLHGPTNPTAQIPQGTDTACIEVWAEELTISSTGEVNADVNSTGAGGGQGTSYIDLFADQEIVVTGKTGAADPFSVHADSLSGSDTTSNKITVLSHLSTISATGKAFSASDTTGNGSSGGRVILEASGLVNLDTATVQAAGDNVGGGAANPPPCDGGSGQCGAGGQISVRSYLNAITWQNGVGDVNPDRQVSAQAGLIFLTACTTITTTGTNFDDALVTTATGLCGAGPALPAYVEAAFVIDRPIWDRCNPATKSGYKFNDLNGNHLADNLNGVGGEPGLNGWTIKIYDGTQANLIQTDVTANDGGGKPGFYEFLNLAPGNYVVCETQQATWTQTAPQAGPGFVTCINEGTIGWAITLVAGQHDTDNNFGNFNDAHKSGMKFNDLNNNGAKDGGEGPIAGWPISLIPLVPAGPTVNTVTDGSGNYLFTITAGGTYRVCEGVSPLPGTWNQTFPNGTTVHAGETVVNTCAAPNIWGYEFTVTSGASFTGDDFGNHQTLFSPPDKSGLKFNDINGNGVRDGGEPVLANWPINLYGPGPVFPAVPAASTVTAADGTYHFTIPSPGPWRVCEGPSPLAGAWNQTFPNATTPSPNAQGETITNACPGPNVFGYEFTATSGVNLVNNDFGNHVTDVCQKPTAIAIMNSAFPGNLGPDITVKTWLGESVQTAVDSVTDSNHDGYLIVFVVANSDFSLGGSANQKVVISKNYTATAATNLPFGLLGCSVTLTGGGTGPAVSIASTAKGKSININGRPTTILVADLHGGNSAVGVQSDGNNRYLRNEGASGNVTGIKVTGDSNTIHNGAANGNTGDGVLVTGKSNLVTDTNSMSNGGNGFNVVGDSNQLLKLDAGEKGTPNTGDGVHVVGNTNTLSEIDAYANGGDGIDVAGNTNTLNKNVAGDKNKGNGGGIKVAGNSNKLTENTANANTGEGFTISGTSNNLAKSVSNSGGFENGSFEYHFFNATVNGGGNKKDNANFTSTAIGTYE